MTRSNRFGPALALLTLAVLPGCATYSNLSYDTALSDEDARAAKKAKPDGKVTSHVSDRFEEDMADLYRRGYTLVGYAKFTSPLVPAAAPWNARQAAKGKGASHVLLARPEPAAMGQHRHLFTYWRPEPLNPPLFGAFYSDADPQSVAAFGCARNLVTVDVVVPGSPAAEAGIREGDVIAAVDQEAVYGAGEVDRALVASASQTVSLGLIRDGEPRLAKVRLGPAPRGAGGEMKPLVNAAGPIGAPVSLQKAERKQVKQKTGVVLTGLTYGSHACAADLRYGDIILAVNGKRTKDTDDLEKRLRKAEGQRATLRLLREGTVIEETLDLTSALAPKVALARRAEIPESGLAQPVWATDEGGDYTWAAVGLAALQAGTAAYQAQVELDRQRALDYARSAPPQGTTVIPGRRGGYTAVMADGSTARISADTAAMIESNPGYTLRSNNRNGGNYGIYDGSGDLVQRIQPASAGLQITTVDMSRLIAQPGLADRLGRIQAKHEIDQLGIYYARGCGVWGGGMVGC